MERGLSNILFNFQFLEKEDRIAHLELELEETRTELGSKLRQISDHQDQINDLKVELASIREQKNSAMKEVSILLIRRIFSDRSILSL